MKQNHSLISFAIDTCITVELDRIGAVINAPRRLQNECNRAFACRLAAAIQAQLRDREQLLAIVQSLSRSKKARN